MKLDSLSKLQVVRDRGADRADQDLRAAIDRRAQSSKKLLQEQKRCEDAELTVRAHHQSLLEGGVINSSQLRASLEWSKTLEQRLSRQREQVKDAQRLVSEADSTVVYATDARQQAYRSREKARHMVERAVRLQSLARLVTDDRAMEEAAEALVLHARRGVIML
jgi:hypothetical protein